MVYPKPPAILTERDLRPADLDTDLTSALLRTYAWMQVARTADNRILDLFRQGLIRGTVTGGQGNEGLVVPLALLADKALDVVSVSEGSQDEVVVEEVRAGYRIGDRVLRPARVRVGRLAQG